MSAVRVVWAGKYAVFDEIAAGGMASVFLACRLTPGEGSRVVCVKKLFESFAKQPEFVTMFLDEAHIAARIRHPNVVTTHEFLRIPDSLGIVMDFVLGISLDDLARIGHDRRTVAPLGVSVAILRDVLAGLHAAHETTDEAGVPVGLVHRDVSPHNVLVGKDGVARVIDFGIAKAAGRLQVTDVGVRKGKFAYMAPEQIRAGAVDRRVDVYSTGIVLWEALTGRQLFRGSTDPELFSRRAGTVTAPLPSSVNPDVPPTLDDVVLKALEIDPNDRFESAETMQRALVAAYAPASQAEVAAWVSDLARSRLRELEAKRNEVETAYAAGELSSALEPPASASAPMLPSLELELPASPSKASPKPAPPLPATKPSAPLPAKKRAPSTHDASQYEDAFADPSADLKLDLAVPFEAPMARTSASFEPRQYRPSMATGPTYAAPRRARGRGARSFLISLAFIAGLAGATWLLGPRYVLAGVVQGAARRGVLLSAASLDVRREGLVLGGVTASLIGVKDVTLTASEMTVAVDLEGHVRKVALPGYELVVKGGAADVGSQVAAWRAGAHLPLMAEAKAGHFVWRDMLAPGVTVEGIDVSMSASSADEGAIVLDAPSLTLGFPRGTLGPWRGHLDSSAAETKLTVALDRSKESGPPSLTVTTRPAIGTVVSLVVPRTKALQVGVPLDVFLKGNDPEVDLAIEAQVMPTGSPLTAHAMMTVYGAGGTGPGSSIRDLVLEGSLTGDPTKPMHIESGTWTVGKTKSRLSGLVTMTPDAIHAEVDRPAGRVGPPPAPFVLDTRAWTAPVEHAGSSTP